MPELGAPLVPSLSNVLIRLVDAADTTINRPGLIDAKRAIELQDLHEEVLTEIKRPREGASLAGPHEILLAEVLIRIHHARQHDQARAPLWCQIGGVLLPVVREDSYRVMLAERDARASTTER